MIDKTILSQLIQEFTMPRSEFEGKNYLTRRREWFDVPMQKKIRPLLDKEKLVSLTVDEAQKIYREMSVGGPRLYPVTFIENGIETIRKSLAYLLYGEELLVERAVALPRLNACHVLRPHPHLCKPQPTPRGLRQ